MADSAVFEWAADELERQSGLSRLEARGALRLVLKQALFETSTVNAEQMGMVVTRLLPDQLRRCGLESADEACRQLAKRLAEHRFGASSPESPDQIFQRLIRR